MSSCSTSDKNVHRHEDSTIDAKQCIVQYFSRKMMYDILLRIDGRLDLIDTNRDGVVSMEELKLYLLSQQETDEDKACITDMLIRNLFHAADVSNSGDLSVEDVTKLSRMHMRSIVMDFSNDSLLSLDDCLVDIKRSLDSVGLSDAIKEDIIETFRKDNNILDKNQDRFISQAEYATFLMAHRKYIKKSSSKIVI